MVKPVDGACGSGASEATLSCLLRSVNQPRWGSGSTYTPHVTSPATYSYEQLAARIEEVLGVRPSLSTLRAAAAEARRTPTSRARARITVGLPAPLPTASRTAPVHFDATLIEAWLAEHPRLIWMRASERFRQRLERGEDVDTVVRQALSEGLPWRTITSLLHDRGGEPGTLAGIHRRYRRPQD